MLTTLHKHRELPLSTRMKLSRYVVTAMATVNLDRMKRPECGLEPGHTKYVKQKVRTPQNRPTRQLFYILVEFNLGRSAYRSGLGFAVCTLKGQASTNTRCT